ncbi:hypothetical protein UFOVP1143_1, partial [uncultured Caudovirales phage]
MKPLIIALEADTRKLSRDLRRAEQQVDTFGGGIGRLGTSLTSMLGPAMIGAGIAAGALAVALGVDGVKGAMEDEAAVTKLAQTMQNLG